MKAVGDFIRQHAAAAFCCRKKQHQQLRRHLLVTLLGILIILVQHHGQATLVRIANKDVNQYFFYELAVDNPYEMRGDNFVQSFNYHVESTCLEKNLSRYGQLDVNSHSDLKAQLQMYSNHEKTMSFIIEIDFNLESTIVDDQSGFELVFETEPNMFSCVQIRFDHLYVPNRKNRVKFKFRLKDPPVVHSSPSSSSSAKYIYYFGKVFMRRLVQCWTLSDDRKSGDPVTNKLCSVDHHVSNKIELGISTQNGKDMIDYYPIDECINNYPFYESCVLRLNRADSKGHGSDDYLIIQPMRDGIAEMIGDSNIFHLTHEEKTLLQTAMNSQKEFIFFNGFKYNVTDILHHSEIGYRTPFYNLLMLKRHKHYDLVFKLVRDEKSIQYMSSIHTADPSNPCYNEQNTTHHICYCSTNQQTTVECVACFRETDWDENGVHYVPHRISKSSIKQQSTSVFSPSCDLNPYHQLYVNTKENRHAFMNIPVVDSFQNQPLSKGPKYDVNAFRAARYNILNNRDTMPRMCVRVEEIDNHGFYDLQIIFNDPNRIGLSSDLVKNKYELRLYQFEFETNTSTIYAVKKNYMMKIHSSLAIPEAVKISDLNVMLSIKNLKFGKYYIELKMIQNLADGLCSESDMCIDEAPLGSYQCVKCNKLITRVDLTRATSSSADRCRSVAFSLNKMEPEVVVTKIRHPEVLKHYFFECSTDLDLSNYSAVSQFSASSQLKGSRSSNQHHSPFVFSFLTPNSKLQQEELLLTELPYIFSPTDSNFAIDECTDNLFYALFGTFLLVSTLAFFSLVYCLYNSYHHNMFCENHKRVVFYISNFLEDTQQQHMKTFIEKYAKLLQGTFQNFEFEVWDYNEESKVESPLSMNETLCCCFKFGTDQQEVIRVADEAHNLVERGASAGGTAVLDPLIKRRRMLDSADRVVYVCGPTRELDRLGVIGLGSHRFDHEYYLLHTKPAFREKTLSIVFSQVEPRESYKQVPRQTNEVFLFLMTGHRRCKLNALQMLVVRISVIKFRFMCRLRGVFSKKQKEFFRTIQNNDLNQRPRENPSH